MAAAAQRDSSLAYNSKPDVKLIKHRGYSPNIELIPQSCQLDEQTHQNIVKGIQFLYDFYSDQLDYKFPRDLVVKIRIFGSAQSYREYIDVMYPSIPKTWIGVYLSGTNEILVSMDQDRNAFYKNVFHETSHLLLSSRVKSCPNWLNEGLAEYFEYMQVGEDGSVSVRPQLVKDKRTKKWLASQEVHSLFESFSVTNRDWNIADGNSECDEPRTIAWSVTYFLMSSPKGQTFVKDLLPYLAKYPGDKYATIRAIDTFYAGGSKQFEKDWFEWVPQPRNEHMLIMQPQPEAKGMSFLKNLVN
jgi:hypothetical protein